MKLLKMTKLVATIGPASDDEKMIERLIIEGVNVFRLNFSHDTHERHLQIIQKIRKISNKLEMPVSILQDLQGPKIRVGIMPEEGLVLKIGEVVVVTALDPACGEIPLQYKGLIKDVKIGDPILLDDGLIELKAISKGNEKLMAKVIVGGVLKSNKGINLPTASISIPAITDKDKKDLAFGIKNEVDFVALSFVKNAADIKRVRNIIVGQNSNAKIVAKVERHEAVENIESIVDAADVVMVARGDLGVEMGMQKVPITQKKIIRECLKRNKPVIVATQMLESMIKSPRPTRAEASDVANAILDGADAVMLSGESAIGKYPLEAVRTITGIALNVEKWIRESGIVIGRNSQGQVNSVVEAISNTVVRLAFQTDSKLILVPTSSGKTATVISNRRPFVPVLATSHDYNTRQYMTILWGVHTAMADFKTVAQMVDSGIKIAKENKYVKKGDLVIVASGKFPGVPGGTNIVEVMTVE